MVQMRTTTLKESFDNGWVGEMERQRMAQIDEIISDGMRVY